MVSSYVHGFNSGYSLKMTFKADNDAGDISFEFAAYDNHRQKIRNWKNAPEEITDLHTKAIEALEAHGIKHDVEAESVFLPTNLDPIKGLFTYTPSRQKSQNIEQVIEAALKPLEFTPSLAEAVGGPKDKTPSHAKITPLDQIRAIVFKHTKDEKLTDAIVDDIKDKVKGLGPRR